MRTELGNLNAVNNNTGCVVVIPVYKPLPMLAADEKLSLQSACTLLKKHTIIFVGPRAFDFSDYLEYANTFKADASIVRFSDHYFTGKDSYSNLLVSTHFYSTFSAFSYMLICQTDAYVFRDDLNIWMELNLSYIGAPWVERNTDGEVILTGSGNGGFSLRKIGDFLRLTKKIESLQLWYDRYVRTGMTAIVPFGAFLRLAAVPWRLNCHINKFTFYLSTGCLQNEDKYWCEWVAAVFPEFSNAHPSQAAQFAIEEEPSYFMNINGGKLPTGCHAWSLNNPEFWKQYIKAD